jgi:hypothetical protein
VSSLDDFAYLWTTERDQWVVLRDDYDEGGIPFNQVTRSALLIDEDDELAEAVVRQMIAKGLDVTTSPD